ncbi:MAG: HAMP domain-containing histidine kinase [Betaproteobacteria bacterium]|nr:HAMP domain-containing histidine kinase [Betaproteobacteria bacterium]
MSDGYSEELDFVACISHDLKSPLNAILGFVHMMRERVEGGQPSMASMAEELRIVQGIGEDMLSLINNMLVAARIQSRSETLEPFLVGEDELQVRAQRLESTFMMEAKSKRIDFCVRVRALPRFVYWDIHKLRYFAINNIVSNALKFVGEGGMVRVEIDMGDRDSVIISVSDDGPGILPGDRSSVFKKFRQSSNNVRSFQGGGLGLFNASAIVQLHGGSIAIHDGIDGRGVSFVMTIPAVPFGFQKTPLSLNVAQEVASASYSLASA